MTFNKYIFAKMFIIIMVAVACNSNHDFLFDPMTNFPEGKEVAIEMDLTHAPIEGVTLPSASQSSSGFFDYEFSFPEFDKDIKYYYKLYYQNESYKFDESDSLSYENFYGSWEDVSIGFIPFEPGEKIKGTLRIVGNPRDEQKYYGDDLSTYNFSPETIQNAINVIKRSPEWYNSVAAKAEKYGVSVNAQLMNDARWLISNAKHSGNVNHRWKRNPRVGTYSFLLVVCDEDALATIPDYIQYIGKTNAKGQFVNPYSWFLSIKQPGVIVCKSDRTLKTKAVISPSKGIFFDALAYPQNDYSLDTSDCRCGMADTLYENALFQQFFSAVSKQYTLNNIPVIHDVVSNTDPYTIEDYNTNKTKFDSTQLIYNYPVISHSPCSTVRVDKTGDFISIINPGNTDPNNLKKESTGVKSRVGFSYGKYTGKIKFPVMLNDENVWNGLTYAFWLIFQDNNEWNYRRPSYHGGYINKFDESDNPQRYINNAYSEIDIEIVKTSKYWPSYKKEKEDVDAPLTDDVMFCSTNWDLACPEPPLFSSGIKTIRYKGHAFKARRWYKLYKALTIKSPISNEVFKEDYYYYEIEWKPKEIIWRVGPSPGKMKVVGYMNDQYTSIPNNQMLAIITQEYHYSEWWPPIIFEQGFIPYNASDIEGKIYEITIE